MKLTATSMLFGVNLNLQMKKLFSIINHYIDFDWFEHLLVFIDHFSDSLFSFNDVHTVYLHTSVYDILYFNGRHFRGQKLSRVPKIAKFREFKFREFHLMKKIYGKNFRDFLKILIFGWQ